MRMNEFLCHTITLMNLVNSAEQRSQTPKSTCCIILFREISEVGEAYKLQYNLKLWFPLVRELVRAYEGDTMEALGTGNILFIHLGETHFEKSQ